MENFRDKLKHRNLLIALACAILTGFCILTTLSQYGLLPMLTPVTGDSHWGSAWRGFISGAAAGMVILLLIALFRNVRALCSEAALKKLRAQEKDERTAQICICARSSAMQVLLLLGMVAVIVAGYFSIPVCITILACVLFASLCSIGFKAYYSKKM